MNWRNSKLQSFYFLYGGCFTIDGAIHKAWGNYRDRESTVASVEARKVISDAKLQRLILRATQLRDSIEKLPPDHPSVPEKRLDLLEMAGELMEVRAAAEDNLRSYNKAIEECEVLRSFINDLLPYSKYDWLNNMDEAAEKAQLEEWTYELLSRAIDMLSTQGTIGYDHLQTMKTMPTYETVILPVIQKAKHAIQTQGHLPNDLLITNHTIAHRFFNILPSTTLGDLPDFDMATAIGYQQKNMREALPMLNKNTQDLLPARAPEQTPLVLGMNLTSEEAFVLDKVNFQPKLLLEIDRAQKLLGLSEESGDA
jgi:hypothetical protein